MGIPKVVFQPETHQGMQGGINQLAEAIRPTLGPLSRIVAINSLGGDKAPELLDSGGIIARRIIELPHRTADMGAMYLRHILWQVQEEVGDGVATTAVLFQTIYNEGVHYIAAGGNAMILRHHLESGLGLILEEINRMTVPLTGPNQLVRMAESVCYDPPLAKTLGEIFDLIGEYGRLEIRTDYSPEINREYVEGSYWDSNSLLTQTEYGLPSKVKRELPNASILVSDFDLEAPSEMLVFLDKMHKAGLFNLILITKSLSAGVLALLHQANQEANRFKIIAVKTPGTAFIDQTALLDDIAILSGGRSLLTAAGDSLGAVTPADLGSARRAWADSNYLGLVRGKADPHQLRTHLSSLRSMLSKTTELKARRKLQQRIGQLLGGTAVLRIGAATEKALEVRKALAQRAADALRGAIAAGVVPGGGAALLACQPLVRQQLEQATRADERAAYRILDTALEAPARALMSNAGYEASVIMSRLAHAETNFGFDVISGQVLDMTEAGIWDSGAVLKSALRSAITGAALALTTDVLVHHKTPQQAMKP